MSKKPVSRPLYEEMEDTSWITGLRGIGDAGNQGILDNYNKVNVFDELTQRDLDSRVNNIYNRALGDFERDYRNTMEKTLARDYGRFGTTGATPSLYNRDIYNLQQQRKLADLQYDKASTYDNFLNSELGRRYATMNMFNQMSQKGAIPYQQDVRNWEIRNMNKDLQWMNDIDYNNYKKQRNTQYISLPATVIGAAVGGYFGGPAGAKMGAELGNSSGNAIGGAIWGGPQYYTNQGMGGISSTQYPDVSGQLVGTANSIYGYGGGSSTMGQGWGQVFSNLFGNNSSQSGNSALSSLMSNSILGNSNSGNYTQNAIDQYVNGNNNNWMSWVI